MDYVIEAARTLNLSRAAENLFTSQPALSYQIKVVEEEVDFAIFDRISKSIRLTPAGQQLVTSFGRIRGELTAAIEQAQNMGGRYQNSIKIGFASRSALYYLPDAIKVFDEKFPTVQIVPEIAPFGQLIGAFLRRDLDLILLPNYEAEKLSNIETFDLFDSHIYLLCKTDDELAQKKIVTSADLAGRTLLVNGGSSKLLRQVQQRVISQVPISHFNSPTHDFTLIQVAAGKAICLSPGYLNDHTDAFAWVPFDCPETFHYQLCHAKGENRLEIKAFMDLLKEFYEECDLNL